MKKRLLSLFLAMVLGLMPTALAAEGETAVKWNEDTQETTSPAESVEPDGIAILTAATKATGGYNAAGAATQIATDTVWQGQRSLQTNLVIEEGVTLTIKNKVTISGNVTISGGGTIKRAHASGCIYVASGNALTLDGVTVDGDNLEASDPMIQVSYGTVHIKDSTVQNCKATSNKGSAISVKKNGELTIDNSTIQNCQNTADGRGAIYLNSSTVTINSGTFQNNTATQTSGQGGFIYNDKGTLTINGGTFTGNSAGWGGVIYMIAQSNTKTYINGGTFTGNTATENSSGAVFVGLSTLKDTVFSLSGEATFTGNGTAGTDGIYFSNSGQCKAQITSELKSDVPLYLSSSAGWGDPSTIAKGTNSYSLTEADARHLKVYSKDQRTSTYSKCYTLLGTDTSGSYLYFSTTPPEQAHCVCGKSDCSGAGHDKTAIWQPWTKADSLPTTAGNYYLLDNVTLTDTWTCNDDVNLCLNGKTITGPSGGDVIKVESSKSLTITDCQTNVGKITHAENGTGRGISNYGTLTLWKGNITGNHGSGEGGGVYNNGTLNISGAPNVSGNIGGNVYLPRGKTITVNDSMDEGAEVGITGTEGQTVVEGTTSTTGFFSDNAEYGLVANSDDTGLKLAAKTVTISGVTLLDSENGNAVTESTKVYDGTAVAYSGGTYEPSVSGVTLSYTWQVKNGDEYENISNNAAPSDVGDYRLHVEAKRGNSTLGTEDYDFTITQRELAITGATVTEKTYDGDTSATITAVIFGGLQNGETLTKGTDYAVYNAAYNSANASEANKVSFTVTLNSTDITDNYRLATTAGSQDAKINKATINDYTAKTAGKRGRENTYAIPSGYVVSGGTVTVEGTTDSNSILDGTPTYANGTLTYRLKNTATEEDTATVTLKVTSDNYNDYNIVVTVGVTAKEQVTINIAPADEYVYNGSTQAPTITVEGDRVAVDALVKTYKSIDGTTYDSNAAPTNAGKYTMTVSVPDSNLEYTGSATCNFEIKPKTLTATITAENKPYDGTKTATVQATLEGAVSGDNVTAEVANPVFKNKNVGENKEVTASISLTGDAAGNYTVNATAETKATISPKDVTITGVTVAESKTYDGSAAAIVITTNAQLDGKVDTDELTIKTGTAAYEDKNVGATKTVTFSGFALEGTDKDNYKLTAQPASVKAAITAKTLTVKNLSVANKTYDGTNTASISGTPTLEGVLDDEDVTLVNGKPTFSNTAVGTNIPISFTDFSISGDAAKNYTLTQPTGITANITAYNATGAEYTTTTKDWTNQDFVVTAAEGWQVSETNTADGNWVESLNRSEETGEGSLTFYVKNTTSGSISEGITENYKIDKTAPTGEIKIDERNGWQTFLNTITFNLFYKDEQYVTLTANDAASGVKAIEYFMTEDDLSIEQLADKTFTEYTEAFGIKPDAKLIVYVRITDTAGNVTYLRSDGVVLDATAPVINGAENGKTYCEAVTLTITDENLDTVTLNNETVQLTEGKLTLNPAEGTQTVVATDRAGNSTSITVTVNNGHTWGYWTSNGDGTHKRTCTLDAAHTETGNCTGGEATCKNKAVCTVCGGKYGNTKPDKHSGTAVWTQTATTHEKKWSCCNVVVVASEPHEWENGKCSECGYECAHTGGEATCKDKAVCTNCGKEYGDLAPHQLTKVEAKAATCTEKGNMKYWQCSVCEKNFSDENGGTEITKVETEKNADNHSGTLEWTTTATTHEKKWSCCNVVVVASEPHEWENGRCSECGYECAHTGGEATCTAKAKCETCGKAYGDLAPHQLTKVEAKAATCTEKGWNAYSTCSRCNYTTYEEIPAQGHQMTHYPAVAATCAAQGSVEYWHCADCNKNFNSATGGAVLATVTTVENPNKHSNLRHIAAKAATETTEGNMEYWHCEGCGKYYKDANATTEISYNDTVISKLNHTHTWGDWVSNGNGTHTRNCSGCTATETKDCSGGEATCKDKAVCTVCRQSYGTVDTANHTGLTHIDAVDATEAANGNIEYWYCDGCGKYYKDADATKKISHEDIITTWSAVPATGLTLSKKELTLVPGDKIPLTATVTPTNSTDPVTWSSSDPAIVTVNDTGEVKAVDYGTAVITARAGSKTAICTVYVVCTTEQTCVSYTDVPVAEWYHSAVDYVTGQGIMQGNGNKDFAPEETLTRAQMSQILYNCEKEVVNGGKEPKLGEANTIFSDVEDKEWYATAVKWAASNGIVEGDGEADGNTFRPNDPVNREEMVTMLYRYMVTFSKKLPLPATGAEEWKDFPDSKNVADWAEKPFAWAVHYGIINGDDGRLNPQNTATRAQAAKIVMVATKVK